MKKGKTIVRNIVVIVIVAVLFAPAGALSNFRTVNTYSGQFADVQPTDWFAPFVRQAYEFGLMRGVSDTQFAPNDNLTLAQTIALAVRIHVIYTGAAEPEPQSADYPWYKHYVDFALDRGIITSAARNFNAPAPRREVAVIFADALPQSALEPIRDVPPGTIPDLRTPTPYSSAVYTLYRAGILSGNDRYGTFNPGSNIRRSEIAAIMVRIANSEERSSNPLYTPERTVETYPGFEEVIDFGAFSGAHRLSYTRWPISRFVRYDALDFYDFDHFESTVIEYEKALLSLGFTYEAIDGFTVLYTGLYETVRVEFDDTNNEVLITARRLPQYCAEFPELVDFGWFARLTLVRGPVLYPNGATLFGYAWNPDDDPAPLVRDYIDLMRDRGFTFIRQDRNGWLIESDTLSVAVIVGMDTRRIYLDILPIEIDEVDEDYL